MGERREDSVLLALNELKKIQDERRQEEEDEERRKEEGLKLAREAEVRRAVEEEERKKREEQDRIKREAEEKARQEREERMKVAAAAAEAEARERVKADHDLNLHKASLDAQHKKKVPWMPIGIIGGVAVAVVATLLYNMGKEKEKLQEIAEDQARQAQKAQEENERLTGLIEQGEQRARELEAKLAGATTDEERRKIKQQIDSERNRLKNLRRGPRAPAAPAKKPGIQIKGDLNDPLEGL